MITLLNCKLVRKKARLYVCDSYTDGTVMLCFVCVSPFLKWSTKRISWFFFFLTFYVAGWVLQPSGCLLVFWESPVNEALCLALGLMITGLALGGISWGGPACRRPRGLLIKDDGGTDQRAWEGPGDWFWGEGSLGASLAGFGNQNMCIRRRE